MQVVCSFPLSSNYGPGSRILYYVLVAACVTFRKAEWLRNACLAAALVLPAISAIQALVLAASHVNGVVDMDIYGAFQFCAIGILAAPLTVRLSRTYFYDPGRNIIFLWTILILMGLMALCVEFYRVTPTHCFRDDLGNELPRSPARFPWGNAECNLNCSEERGPVSPMRGGAAGEVHVVPVPRILSFNTAMLLAAGFCIPAILSLIFTFDKILEINWKRRRQVERLDDQIEGANITVREMKGINDVVRVFLGVIEIPLFGGVILTIIGMGEANFFSPQVLHETEPMASIGQWSPIAGTLLAALGSLYLLWSKADEDVGEKPRTPYQNSASPRRSRSSEQQPFPGRPPPVAYAPYGSSPDNALGIRSPSFNQAGLIPVITHPESDRDCQENESQDHQDEPTAGRNRVRKWLTSAGNHLGNVAHEKLDVSDFNDQKAHHWPEVPGEILRNPALEETSKQYSQLREENSRAGSMYAASIASRSGIEGASTPPLAVESPRPETSPARKPRRRDTLEVPTRVQSHRGSESH